MGIRSREAHSLVPVKFDIFILRIEGVKKWVRL
jgi:hypothetical protein